MRKNKLIYKNNDIMLYDSDIHNAKIGKTWSVLNNTHHAISNINWVEKYTLVYKDTEKAAYLINYIIQKMYRVFRYMISTSTV